MKDAGSLVSITLLLLMAKYGTNIGPTIPDLIASSPALILQEFGNIGTVFLGVPLGLALGMGREVIGAAHSIGREPNVALIADKYGLDSPEGEGVLGVYIVGTVLGTILISLLASILATVSPLHPYSLAMAAGVGSASMMTAGGHPGGTVPRHDRNADLLRHGIQCIVRSGRRVYVAVYFPAAFGMDVPKIPWQQREPRCKEWKIEKTNTSYLVLSY